MTVQEAGAPPGTPPRRPSPWLGPVRVTGAVLGVGLIGIVTLGLIGQFSTRVSTESFTVTDPVKALTVKVGSGDIRVYADAPGTPVHVDATIRSGFRKAGYTKAVKDGTLDLTGTCEASWVTLDDCSVSFQLVVPSDITVDVHTQSGDQWLMDTTEAARLRAGSGDIYVRGVTGGLTVQTGSGDIKSDSLTSSQADLRTGSGDIRANFSGATDAVTARTGSGDIRATFQVTPGTVAVKTGAGDVRVTVPDDGTRYDVSGSTGSGDRHIEVPTGSNSHRIEADTGSGDVTINVP